MKPFEHSLSSIKKFGGSVSDYLKIHDWFDQTKSHVGNNCHRAILHNSFGVFLAEQMFGHVITNSENKQVSVREIGEQHIFEDLGFIPTVSDYLENLQYQPWMSNEKGAAKPSSQKSFLNVKFEKDNINLMLDGSSLNFYNNIKKEVVGLDYLSGEYPTSIQINPTDLFVNPSKSMQHISD
jgi:hypothetical protein